MTSKSISTSAIAVVLALSSAGCDYAITDPALLDPIEIVLDFCSDETPIWFAHQNGNQPAQFITPDQNGTYRFTATRRVTLAFVRQSGSDYRTEMIFTSNADLEPLSGLQCLEETGTKSVNGNVSGVTGSQLGLVGMSVRSVYLTANQTSFTLNQLVDRPLDLIASRIDVSGTEQHANKTIIRRSQTPASGSTLSSIDFDAEGFDLVSNNAIVSGMEPDVGFLMNNFFSQLETSHALTFVDALALDASIPFVSIPTVELATGDYHDLFVVATTAGGSRGVELFFRDPGTRTISLGPPLAEPSVTVANDDPYVRMRVELEGQFEYTRMVTLDFRQETPFSTTEMSMFVTASHFGGTPTLWILQMPNFDGLQGWNNSWGLQPGTNVDWTVTAYNGSPRLVFGAKPAEGESVGFASRSATTAAAQQFRSSRIIPRSRVFSRLR